MKKEKRHAPGLRRGRWRHPPTLSNQSETGRIPHGKSHQYTQRQCHSSKSTQTAPHGGERGQKRMQRRGRKTKNHALATKKQKTHPAWQRSASNAESWVTAMPPMPASAQREGATLPRHAVQKRLLTAEFNINVDLLLKEKDAENKSTLCTSVGGRQRQRSARRAGSRPTPAPHPRPSLSLPSGRGALAAEVSAAGRDPPAPYPSP